MLKQRVRLQVCNHPDLFEGRPIVSSFDMWGLPFHMPSLALHALSPSQWGHINLSSINADVVAQESDFVWAAQRRQVRHKQKVQYSTAQHQYSTNLLQNILRLHLMRPC